MHDRLPPVGLSSAHSVLSVPRILSCTSLLRRGGSLIACHHNMIWKHIHQSGRFTLMAKTKSDVNTQVDRGRERSLALCFSHHVPLAIGSTPSPSTSSLLANIGQPKPQMPPASHDHMQGQSQSGRGLRDDCQIINRDWQKGCPQAKLCHCLFWQRQLVASHMHLFLRHPWLPVVQAADMRRCINL